MRRQVAIADYKAEEEATGKRAAIQGSGASSLALATLRQ